MIADDFDDLRAEFTRPYSIEVEIRGDNGAAITRTSTVDGLLVQLERAATPGSAGPAAGASGAGYESKPPAALSALNLLDEIRRGLDNWSRYYAGRPGATPAAALDELAGVVLAMDTRAVTDLVAQLQGWRTRARWVLGWESPPFAPHVPCPDCAGVGTLRLWAQQRYVACLLCGTWWDSEHLGQLRDRLRLSRDLAHVS